MLELIDTGGSEGGPGGRHWVLDPIDGTRGFVGLRQYAICLGMLQDGEVRASSAAKNAMTMLAGSLLDVSRPLVVHHRH